mgnify:CR=1 FL=1
MCAMTAGSVIFSAVPTTNGPLSLPTQMKSGLPRAMRFAFQLSGEVVVQIVSFSQTNHTGAIVLRSPLFRCVAT